MEEGIQKQVKSKFIKVLNKVKDIFEIEKENLSAEKIEEHGKIVVQFEELYDDWIENVETISLPKIDKIEQIQHSDGPYLKVDYILDTEEGKLLRKVRIKSNGKVNIYNYIIFDQLIDGKTFQITTEYDTYGNLIFLVEKV